MKIITREEAISSGLTRYFTNKPCKSGHTSERWVNEYKCIECDKILQIKSKEKRKIRRDESKTEKREYDKKYRIENKDRINIRVKQWSKDNPARIKSLNREWYLNNKDRHNECSRRNYEKYPERAKLRSHLRTHSLKVQTPSWYEDDEVNKLYKLCVFMTKFFHMSFHVDHIVPLQGKLVSGLHCFDNLQILTAEQNRQKSNSFLIDQ